MSVFILNQESEEEVDNPSEIESKTITVPTMLQMAGNVNEAQDALNNFWPKVTEEIRNIRQLDLKNQALPLARIKKIMKLDDGVKMISAEAPMLFSKAAELFINELTLRAWIHTEDNKRRTLQRNDLAMAITKYDMFDFLIDIVPREEVKPPGSNSKREEAKAALNPDQVQYYFQLAQQTALQTGAGTTGAAPTLVLNGGNSDQCQPQIIQLANPPNTAVNAPAAASNQSIQIVQQVLSPSGEVQNIPLQLTPAQLAMIRANGNQSITLITQTAPSQSQQIIQVAPTSQSNQN